MHIEHLSLTNFRNYARLELSLPQQPVVLHGDNAQGKTSLLEAIYYLATSKSPYTTSDRQLIHWRTDNDPIPYARMIAEFSNQQSPLQRMEVTLMMDKASGATRFKKTIKVNNVEKRVMDVVGMLNVVLFVPRDLSLIEGSPADRRRFMDITLGQVNRDYAEALEEYDKVLPQRNALLRRIAEKRSSIAELAYWDEQLTTSGSVIISERQQFLRELESLSQQNHHQLTGNTETLTLQYQPSFLPTFEGSGQLSFDMLGLDLHRDMTAEAIKPQFAEQLEKEQRASIERGVTLSGPHRDELRLLINGRDCGLYGSRGQARTTVMALKLAEYEWMKRHIGENPILLLDEVVAELDSKRRAFLLDRLMDNGQMMVTTTELEIFTPTFLEQSTLLNVIEGQIVP
ncbi:MAG: DNA replication/repair protein RecF [Phototrophicaceae bacterium]